MGILEIIEIIFGSLSVIGAIISFLYAKKSKKYSQTCDEITLIEKIQEIILKDCELKSKDNFTIDDVKQVITFSVEENIIQKAMYNLYRTENIYCDNNIISAKDISSDYKFTLTNNKNIPFYGIISPIQFK